MPQANTKRTWYNEIRKQGGSYVVSIPKEIIKHLQLEKGDELAFQKEQSQKIAERKDRTNGDYTSIFNETVQSGKRKPEGE